MNRQKAFTLIEIIVTAVIIGILTILVLPNFSTMINRSYSQDAMRNLMTIYAAQQEYSQNHGGAYLACADLSAINNSSSGLNLNIVGNGGTAYACTPPTCTATASSFTMVVTLNIPVSVQSNARYCNQATLGEFNPCCSGGVSRAVCP